MILKAKQLSRDETICDIILDAPVSTLFRVTLGSSKTNSHISTLRVRYALAAISEGTVWGDHNSSR